VISGAPGAQLLFDVVFFIIVVGSLLPGATIGWVTPRFKVQSSRIAPPATVVSMDSPQGDAELRLFFIEEEVAAAGAPVEALPFPKGAAITMIERVGTPLAVTGGTVLRPGDYVYILYPRDCAGDIELLFGPPI
jgi:cell volume regulation protein A